MNSNQVHQGSSGSSKGGPAAVRSSRPSTLSALHPRPTLHPSIIVRTPLQPQSQFEAVAHLALTQHTLAPLLSRRSHLLLFHGLPDNARPVRPWPPSSSPTSSLPETGQCLPLSAKRTGVAAVVAKGRGAYIGWFSSASSASTAHPSLLSCNSHPRRVDIQLTGCIFLPFRQVRR